MAVSKPPLIQLAPLYPICDADVCARAGWTLIDFASACLDGGAQLLQVRAKTWPAARLLDEATEIVGRARRAGARVIVNDRADVARLSGAAGVHVGQEDLTPAAARTVVGSAAAIGLSTHTIEQIDAALLEPITYVAVGPVFGTTTKATGYRAVGTERVKYAVGAARDRGLPIVAIGGITLDNAAAVFVAGATSVAVITDLLALGDPAARVRQYLEASQV